jgi:hypothetical protein
VARVTYFHPEATSDLGDKIGRKFSFWAIIDFGQFLDAVSHREQLGIFYWGRCYDHNFRRFSTIFGEKIAVFLKNQCYDKNFA